jgi:hypothetical protein
MAETVRKKAAKKASGKKRGRPKKKNVTQTTTHLERAAAMVVADTGLPYDEALQKVTAEYEARKAQAQPKRGPGRPRKDAGDRINVMDAGDALDTIENSTPASRTLTQREKNAFERNFGEGTAFDLDYGKLLIIALCIYIAVKVS